MSIEALTWVFRLAPVPKPGLFAVLTGLANHADAFGRGSHPSQEVLAAYARKTKRQVRKDLDILEGVALIRRGDQRLVAHIPPDRRPVVWDLAMEVVDEKLAQFWGDRREWRRGRREESREISTGGNHSSSRKADGGNHSSGRGGNHSSGRGGNHSSAYTSLRTVLVPTADPYVSADARTNELRRSAAEWLAKLPNANRVSASRREWVTGLAVQALAAGWTPEALRREVLDGTEHARDRWALYGHRLEHLGPPERLDVTSAPTAGEPCIVCGQLARANGLCDMCRGNARGRRPREGPSRPPRAV